jgi:lysophospholipase L1-like esterase
MTWITTAAEEEGVELINLQDEWIMEDEQYFRDYIHYSPRGAAWFSTRLASEILLPRLQQD